MKFNYKIITLIVVLISATAWAGLRDRSSSIELYGDKDSPGSYIYFPELTTAPGTPDTGWGSVYVSGNDIYFKDDLGVATSMIGAASGGVSNLDEAYDGGGSGVGREIAVDQDGVLLTGTSSGGNTLEITGLGTGDLLQLTNTGTGYDIDGTSWTMSSKGTFTSKNGGTLNNDTNNVWSLTENSEDLDIEFGTNLIDFSTDTGAVTWELYDGVASTLTKTANGAADDLTLSVTGAQDSSLVLSSAGTGADALQVSTSAGGIDITVSGGAAGEDIDISTDTSINLSATENAADSITLLTNGGTNETIDFTNTQGTDDAAFDINASAGGIDIDAAKSVTITSAENTADSIELLSDAGGITLNAASGVVFTQGQTRKVKFTPKEVELDGTSPAALTDHGTDGHTNISVLAFDADGGATGDDIAYISWVVPDGYIVDSARLNVAYTFSTAEDAADEAQFDFTVNSVAAGEALDAAGTALADQTTVIADASADNGKLHISQYNIEVEDIAVDDMVTIQIAVDESASALSASGTLDVLYLEIEYESTE